MTTNIVQVIHLTKEDYNIAIKGIIPETQTSGKILLLGHPMKCLREEVYTIINNQVVTQSWNFPIDYLIMFLSKAGSVDEKGNVILTEVLPKNYKEND